MSPHAILGSPARDFAWFLGPGVLAAVVAVGLGVLDPKPRAEDAGLGLWIAGVLLVDVAHVWASLYRTYLDPVARRLHRTHLLATPLLVLWIGALLHLESPRLFWGVLAYVAIFHFIKQHLGFALIYVRAGGEGRRDRRLVEAAIWAGTAAPVVWWHAHLPTRFVWFIPGDLLTGLPSWLGPVALWAEVPVLLAFAVRRLQLRRRGRGHPLVPWLVLVPAINWHLGIVLFDDDRIFTITNVFLHGVPYLALVWVAGGRQRVESSLSSRGRPVAVVLAAYYGLLVALAAGEEALWDRLVWHDHPELFGTSAIELGPLPMAVVVALLTVPQATHYVLDRFIWRVGPQNPALADQLGLSPPSPS
ncbi:hypothetical protein [Paraliomyxa miuraensis]|uniref:hypothetical protein n=1 Tax=Paraliomyxa miuraensis TaxID=376150 RepID=UPI00224E0C65|nr:hypothetical protein [Paraliomyxa miuraensis]MCX4243590.1 hypothetical protein [Paraliomyxa miuraensis]